MKPRSTKSDRFFYLLLQLFIFIAVIGLIILVVADYGKAPSDIAFSLIAFIISVAALVMTTLQSVSISRQVRVTKHAAQLVRDSTEAMHELLKEERVIEREIRADMALDREIVSVLEEYGIGDNHDERKQVAAAVAKKVSEISTKKPRE